MGGRGTKPAMNLENKTIAITGGGRGLGAAMALRLAASGTKLALVDLDEDALAETAKACTAAGSPQVATYKANVASEPEVEQLFADIAGDFGALAAEFDHLSSCLAPAQEHARQVHVDDELPLGQ